MNIEQARFNMIEQQVRPWRVNDAQVLDILSKVQREEFVPAQCLGMAFADTQVPLDIDEHRSGQVILPPKMDARMLQALAITPQERVLEIGTGSGYGTALLGHCSQHITSWELDPVLAEFAAANLRRAGFANFSLHTGDAHEALQDANAQWDVIVFSGAVALPPEDFLARLKPGGRLFCYLGEAPVMEACVYTHTQGNLVRTDLYETMAPTLKGFPVPNHFRF
ncbi:MAG: protein-L-isoaspartate O-methyltransferase [Lautropia sp.]|nr:protein-L-isoaspartate O-methyltransferase [Lautropia sp.]